MNTQYRFTPSVLRKPEFPVRTGGLNFFNKNHFFCNRNPLCRLIQFEIQIKLKFCYFTRWRGESADSWLIIWPIHNYEEIVIALYKIERKTGPSNMRYRDWDFIRQAIRAIDWAFSVVSLSHQSDDWYILCLDNRTWDNKESSVFWPNIYL